jgi:putative membrane protein
MGGYGWLIQIFIFIAFFLVVWWLIKEQPKQVRKERPLEILKRRLASGEITKKEFEDLKKEIE